MTNDAMSYSQKWCRIETAFADSIILWSYLFPGFFANFSSYLLGRKIVTCLTTLTLLTKFIFWTKNGTGTIKCSQLTTLTTKQLSIFLIVQKFGENAEQVLQVLLPKISKILGNKYDL